MLCSGPPLAAGKSPAISFILRGMHELCVYFAFWTTFVAASVDAYTLSRILRTVGYRGVAAVPSIFLIAEEHSGDHQAGSVICDLMVLLGMKRAMTDFIIRSK